jgi:hypothetical protein
MRQACRRRGGARHRAYGVTPKTLRATLARQRA